LPKKKKVHQVVHRPALPYAQIAEFMRALRRYESVKSATLQFAILTAARRAKRAADAGLKWPLGPLSGPFPPSV
jgi:hypothetical protein